MQAMFPMSFSQVLPLWMKIIRLYFSVVFRFSEVHSDLPSGQLMDDLAAKASSTSVELRLSKRFADRFNRDFAEMTRSILKETEEPDFTTILLSSFVVRAIQCGVCLAYGSWGLLVGVLQFLVAPLSFTGSFIRLLTNGSDCLLHYCCCLLVAAFLAIGPSSGSTWTLTLDRNFMVAFLSMDFVLNCLVYYISSEAFGWRRLLVHVAYGSFNTKTYFLVVLGSLYGYRFDLRLMFFASLLTLVAKHCGFFQQILRRCGWPCFPICFYVEHRIGHLPVVYQHAHKMHHYLHDTTAFDAHIYGSGMNEEFFWILAETLPCLLAPSLFFPYFLNLDTLHVSLTNKPAHTRTKQGSYEMDEDNFHADHHTLHRANYGSALGVLLDVYFGTMGTHTKGARGLQYHRREDEEEIVIHLQRCEGSLAVYQNAPCSKDMEELNEESASSGDLRNISQAELFAHRTLNDPAIWIAMNGHVYDMTKFHRIHPGGSQIILQHAGTDATSVFTSVGHSKKRRLWLPNVSSES